MSNERKPAPTVDILDPFTDERKAQAERWDKSAPEYRHYYEYHTVDQHTLASKGAEIVKDAKGNEVRHGRDILCRIPKAVYDKRREKSHAASLARAKRLMPEKDIELERNPKKPKKRE